MSGAEFFKKQSKAYSQFRPQYPKELFQFISSLSSKQEEAWDCACGTGQAARGLAPFYKKVIATDASEEQLAVASAPKNVEMKVFHADKDQWAPERAFDAVCVAQAVHWFSNDRFYQLVKKNLAPGAPLVVWGYGFFKGLDPLERLVDDFSNTHLGPFWSEGNRILVGGYKDLYFPISRPIPAPQLKMKICWGYDEILGYLESWSATQKYKDAHQKDPLVFIQEELRSILGDQKVELFWDLSIRAGTF